MHGKWLLSLVVLGCVMAGLAWAGPAATPLTRLAPGQAPAPTFASGTAVPNAPWSANVLLVTDTNSSGFSPVDCAIAVNGNNAFVTMIYYPNNPTAGGAVFRSTNRGVSWQAPYQWASTAGLDPSLFSGGPDTTYVVQMNGSYNGWVWSRTTDGGNSWSAPATLVNEATGLDKELIAIDTVNTNYIYCEWVKFGTSWGDVHFSRSTDKGTSWSTPVVVNDAAGTGWRAGSVPWVGRGAYSGHVYCFWQDDRLGGDGRICMKKSTDHGATFPGSEITVANIHLVPTDSTINNWRHPMHPFPQYHPRPYPSVGTDSQGRIFVCYCSAPTAGSTRKYDPVVTVSTDEGTTWSTPVSANMAVSGDTADQYLPWLCVDPEDKIHVFWYDLRNYNNYNGDVYYAYSTDHGVTFSVPEMINDVTPCLYGSVASNYQGDYSMICADTGRVFVEWCDNRTHDGSNWQDVDVAYRPLHVGVEEEAAGKPVAVPGFGLDMVKPNPSHGPMIVSYRIPGSEPVRLAVYDIQGRMVKTLVDGTQGAGEHSATWAPNKDLASGVYFYRLEAGGNKDSKRIVFTH